MVLTSTNSLDVHFEQKPGFYLSPHTFVHPPLQPPKVEDLRGDTVRLQLTKLEEVLEYLKLLYR